MREATPNVAEARRMLNKGIVISGVGETEQGKLPGRGSFELLAEATKITLDDAGLTLGEVDGLVTAFRPRWRSMLVLQRWCSAFEAITPDPASARPG